MSANFRLNLLGAFTLQHGNITITKFRSDKIRALLAYLAVEADHPHRRELLATLLWSDMSDSVAKRNLRQSLHRLKQTAGDGADRWLVITRQTVMVRSKHLVSDVGHFQTLIQQCEAHAHRHLHDCQTCLDRLVEAVELYQGAFLQGLLLEDATSFEEWRAILHERLHQQILIALDLLTDAYEQKGQFDTAARFAQRQLDLEAWRESAHRQLMRLRLRLGQPQAALAQFEQCQQVLRETLGIAPEAATQQLVAEIEAGVFSAETPPPALLHHFPTYLTPFIGRAREIEQIATNLSNPDCRLVTLVGGGGIGKTRLSIAAATQLRTQFSDGIIFIPFAPVASVDQFLNSIAAQLGVLLTDNTPPLEKICHYAANKQQLWVLDNLEHLREATPQIITLLTQLPKLKLLVSSREALRIRAEWLLALDGLAHQPKNGTAYSDAETLFWKLARRQQAGLEETAAAKQVVRNVCQWVNGMPLALEMVAAWMRYLSFEEIDQQIGNLDLLVNQYAETPDRHHSLRTVFESTWQMLSPTAQSALLRLTVFRGGFDKASMTAIVKVSFLDLFALLDNFVVHQSAPNRYEFHTLLWQFVTEKRDAHALDTTFDHLADAHAVYYLTQLAQLGTQLSIQGAPQAAQAIRQDWDNIWHAWHWAVERQHWTILGNSATALVDYALHQSAVPQCEQALAAATAAIACVSAETPQLTYTASILKWQFARILREISVEQAAEHLQAALALCPYAAYPAEYRHILTDWGIILWRCGDKQQAQHVLSDALRLSEQANDRKQIPFIKHHLANVYATQSEFARAEPLYLAAISESRAANQLLACAGALNDFAALAILQLNTFQHGFQIDPASVGAQQVQTLLPYLLESFRLYVQLGYQVGICLAAGNLSFAYFLCDEYALAMALEAEVQVVSSANFYPDLSLHIAHIHAKQGAFVAAAAKYKEAWIVANRSINHMLISANALTGLAYIHIQQGNACEAAKLLGAITNIARDMDHARLDSFEKVILDQCHTAARAALSEQAFERCWSIGADMSPQTIATMLQD